MKILVCGGRNLDSSEVQNILDRDLVLYLSAPITRVIHGGARGADTGGAQWGRANRIPVSEYKANWDVYGKSAGVRRNQQMIDEGKPDYVVAFPGGRGTADMIRRAEQHNIPVIRLKI